MREHGLEEEDDIVKTPLTVESKYCQTSTQATERAKNIKRR